MKYIIIPILQTRPKLRGFSDSLKREGRKCWLGRLVPHSPGRQTTTQLQFQEHQEDCIWTASPASG